MTVLRPVLFDQLLEVLRVLVDRRRRIGEERTVKVCQLHQLPLVLIPGVVEVGDITRFPDKAHFASWTDRDRADRRLLRRPRPTPVVPRRQPADQPGAAPDGHRPTPQPHRGRLLRPEEGQREDVHGSDALPQTPPVRHRLPHHAHRLNYVAVQATSPGGHRGTTPTSSVASSRPHTGSSEKSLPEPVTRQRRNRRRGGF